MSSLNRNFFIYKYFAYFERKPNKKATVSISIKTQVDSIHVDKMFMKHESP